MELNTRTGHTANLGVGAAPVEGVRLTQEIKFKGKWLFNGVWIYGGIHFQNDRVFIHSNDLPFDNEERSENALRPRGVV